MQFQSRQQPPALLGRKDRSRLIWMGLGLIIVFAAIKVAADPATWATFFSGTADSTTAAPGLADVSFEVALSEEEGLEPDEFRSGAAPVSTEESSTADEAPPTDVTFPAELFAEVKDNTLNLRAAEQEAYFTVLARLRDLDAAVIKANADQNATFPAVMLEPDHYRGRLISIEGLARRIIDLKAGANQQGFETLYELWVFTPDSRNNPWRVVSVNLPEGLPRGVIDEGVPVRINGVFFKRQGYETQGHELHVAPLLLAQSVTKTARGTRAISEFNPTPYVLWLLGIVVAVIGLFAWRFYREDKTFAETTLSRFTEASKDEVAAIPPTEPDDPDAFFRKMREDELRDENKE